MARRPALDRRNVGIVWALAPVLVAFVVQLMLWSLISPYVWFLFYPAVFASSWLGGLRRGLVATGLSAALVWWFFVEPTYEVLKPLGKSYFPLVAFVLMGAAFGAVNQRLHDATRRSQEAAERVRQLDAARTEFFANVSHELRTPLALILGTTQRLLAGADLVDRDREGVELVERSGRLLLRQVNELLEISRLEVHELVLEHADVDLVELVRRTAEPFGQLAEARGVTLVTELPATQPAQVDPERVERCVMNLLSNAFRFTPAGGSVRVHLEEQAGTALLEVADSGPGIPTEERETVFQRYRQVRRGNHRGTGGTGLGLAIAREVAQLHGGSLVVGEAPEGGALLQLRLPTAAPPGTEVISWPSERLAGDDLRAAAEELAPAPPVRVPEPQQPSDVPVVLVLEDNRDLNHLICTLLEDDYQVVSAHDGTTALRLARRTRPSLVLTDLMMPGMPGEEFLQLLRADADLADVPVVVLTARQDDALRVRLLEEGVNDFLSKPFAVPELRARVDNLVRMRRAELARRRAQSRAEGLLEASPDATVVVDGTGTVVQANRQAESLFGWTREELIGSPVERLVPETLRRGHAERRDRFLHRPIYHAMGSGLDPVAQRKDGSVVPVDITLSPISTPDGPMVIASVRDVTALRERQDQLRTLALHDPLTELPNRVLLMDRLGQALADLERRQGVVAVCYLDLDRFKEVNDSWGHEAGDRLLVEVAGRLRGVVRPHDTVARLGGDEFAVVCGGLLDEAEPVALAARMEEALRAPLRFGAVDVDCSASVGVVWTADPDEDPLQLIRRADEAMYAAKHRGPGQVQVYQQCPGPGVGRRAIEAMLLEAIDAERLELRYQPVVDLTTGRVSGFEALLRVADPVRGVLAPAAWLSVAESSGLIVAMGTWAMREALGQLAEWHEIDPDLTMSVNLSSTQLVQDWLPRHVAKALRQSKVDPRRVCFEMTESVLLEATDVVLANLEDLRGQGIAIAVDDFGTGWSSLTYLKQFAVDVLKIDRAFSEGLGRSRDDTAIVTAVVQLGHALGLTITIEGVETELQRERAGALGCDHAQGYFFAPPLEASQVQELLRAQASSTV